VVIVAKALRKPRSLPQVLSSSNCNCSSSANCRSPRQRLGRADTGGRQGGAARIRVRPAPPFPPSRRFPVLTVPYPPTPAPQRSGAAAVAHCCVRMRSGSAVRTCVRLACASASWRDAARRSSAARCTPASSAVVLVSSSFREPVRLSAGGAPPADRVPAPRGGAAPPASAQSQPLLENFMWPASGKRLRYDRRLSAATAASAASWRSWAAQLTLTKGEVRGTF